MMSISVDIMSLWHGLKMENISMSEILWNLYAWFANNVDGIIIAIAITLFFLFTLSVVHEDIQIIWGIQPIS